MDTRRRIGCDIGGVLKNLTDDAPVDGAVDAVRRLVAAGHAFTFISKCGPAFADATVAWLAAQGLDGIPIEFTRDYAGKVALARAHGVQVMIDDKLTVLKHFPADEFARVWFCTEQKNIAGARRFDPEFCRTSTHVQSWAEIEDWLLQQGPTDGPGGVK